MLSQSTVTVTIAVKDINISKAFYGEMLGLELVDEGYGGVIYKSGDSKLFIYESQFAGTNKATYATWNVPDTKATVDDLKTKGIKFEHYDFPGTTRDGDIHNSESGASAWFKDPDGNILALTSMTV